MFWMWRKDYFCLNFVSYIKLQTENYWWTTEQEMKTYYYYLIKALYLSANVFSIKVLIGDIISTSPTGDGTAILCGHSSHVKV